MASKLREVFFLIDEDGSILWSDAGDSPVRLPDSRARWEAIWSRRDRIAEIAHSHPVGPLAFSREDETTMRALASALGRSLLFSVVSPDGMIRCTEDLEAGSDTRRATVVGDEPWWTSVLRLASGIQQTSRLELVRRATASSEFE